jgi:hypothetical protein
MTPDLKKDIKKDAKKTPSVLDECLSLMERMTDLLDREADLVKGRRTAELQVLVEEKNKMILTYRGLLKTIEANHEQLKNAPPQMRNLLAVEGKRLAEATARNKRLLTGAVVATRRLVDTIYKAIRRETMGAHVYGDLRRRPRHADDAPVVPSVIISRSA